MNRNFRRRLFKLAQVSMPTDQVASTMPLMAPPPVFQASAMYPSIRTGFASNSVVIIDELVNLLNTALHYATAGTMNFQKLRDINFNFDPSQAPSVDQRNLMNLSKKVFKTLLNSGQAFAQKLDFSKVGELTKLLLTSQEINNLSQISPSGLLATKIPGNLKTLITNYLNYLQLTVQR